MPEPTTAPAPAAPKSVADYLNRTDEEIAAAIGVPPAPPVKGATAKPPDPPAKAAVAAAEPEPAPETPAEPAELAAPVAEAPKPESPKPTPITAFVVRDQEGEVEAPLELKFSFKANEKQYDDVPLDKVVKMAQMGYYNEEREAQVLGAKKYVAEAQQKTAALERKLADIDAQVDRFMRDEAFRQRAIELYQQQNSPEQRAARAEQQVQTIQAQVEREREAQRIVAFVQNDLSPRFVKLLEAHPMVSEQEIIGQYTMLSAPLLENGIVPPQKFSEVVRLVDTDLRHWIEAKHEERTGQQKGAAKAATEATQELAKQKRLVARRVAPPVSSTAPQPAKRTPFKTAQEWLDTALPHPEY